MVIKERQKWGKRLCFCLEHEIVEAFSEMELTWKGSQLRETTQDWFHPRLPGDATIKVPEGTGRVEVDKSRSKRKCKPDMTILIFPPVLGI